MGTLSVHRTTFSGITGLGTDNTQFYGVAEIKYGRRSSMIGTAAGIAFLFCGQIQRRSSPLRGFSICKNFRVVHKSANGFDTRCNSLA